VTIQVRTTDRVDVVDVTPDVRAAVPASTDRGVCTVFVPHTTAGVVVNEHEARLLEDLERALGRLVAPDAGYAHDEIDDNADAHLRAVLLGASVSVPVADGDLALGTWQSILLVECDGPRTRSLEVRTAAAADERAPGGEE
jgi:secondary thiamine-phosphate synthase enzyme